MIEVTAYKCQWCGKFYREQKSLVRSHEYRCYYNPRSRSCATCGEYAVTIDTFYNPHHGGNPGSTDYEYEQRRCGDKMLENRETNCHHWIKTEATNVSN